MVKEVKIKVIQFGLGAMGSQMARYVLEKNGLELVAVLIHSPEKHGKDVGDLLKLGRKTGIKASNKPEEVFKKTKADVMLHAAVSYVPMVWDQIKHAVKHGINVITIAEEMGYPYKKYPKLCKEIDQTAKKHNCTVLGTGINPGFAMDILPILLTGICRDVKKIKATRIVDFSPFGTAIQNNIGIGFTVQDFKQKVKAKKLPLHIGLPESSYMLAKALKWNLDRIVEMREPLISKKPIYVKNYKTTIPAGRVSGFNHRIYGYEKGKLKILLKELGRVDPKLDYKNTIEITGIPNLKEEMNVPPGNITTTSHAVNLIPQVVASKPGLKTMLDMPIAPVLLEK